MGAILPEMGEDEEFLAVYSLFLGETYFGVVPFLPLVSLYGLPKKLLNAKNHVLCLVFKFQNLLRSLIISDEVGNEPCT